MEANASVLDEEMYKKGDDYDALLAHLDLKSKVNQQNYHKIKNEISLIEEQMKTAAGKASKGLEQA